MEKQVLAFDSSVELMMMINSIRVGTPSALRLTCRHTSISSSETLNIFVPLMSLRAIPVTAACS